MSSDAPAGAGDAASAAAPATVSFKKKGAKRKEFRAPAASLASRTDAALLAAPTSAAAAEPAQQSGEEGAAPTGSASADATETADAQAAVAPASAAAAAAVSVDDDDSSDDDDSGAPRRSIALSAADAAAAAAAVSDSDPEDANAVNGADVQRPAKRVRRENPLLASTRNKLRKDTSDLNISSSRSAAPDLRTADKQVSMDVSNDPARQKARDPNKPKWSGPAKPQAANVRMISRFDYQPDICKDYKETGRCGYGDSCKFLHDRGDYKQGWQLDRDWAEEQEAKRKRVLQGLPAEGGEESFEIKADEQLPWACDICRQPFVQPVVTKCKHYFCEKCALDHYVKDSKCFTCRGPTSGIFNTATELIAVMRKRAASGHDPRAELEAAERERLAEKAALDGAAIV